MTKEYRTNNLKDLAKKLGIDPARAVEAEIKAGLTKALINEINKRELSHQEVADLADVSRTTITGIVNGSLQKITVDRLLRIVAAVGLSVELRIKKSA